MSANLNIGIILEAIDRATGPIRRIMRQMDRIVAPAKRVSRAVGDVGKEARSLALKLGALTAGGAFLFKRELIDTAAAFERFQTILETTEGTSAGAKKAMDWISDFATSTPYELDQVTDAYVKLRSYGLDPTNGLLRTLGDTSAAMGKGLDQSVEAIADAVTGENERLKEFGITARVLGKKIVYEYTANGQTMHKVAQRGNRAMIQSVLTGIWNEKYAGAMQKLSLTWEGMVSNLLDQWTRFKNLIMDAGVFDFLKSQLKGVLDRINAMAASGELRALANEIGPKIVEALKQIVAAAVATGEILATLGGWTAWLADKMGGWKNLLAVLAVFMAGPLIASLYGLTAAVVGFGVALMATPIGWFIAALAGIVGVAGLIWQNWDKVSASLKAAWDRFGWLIKLIPGVGQLATIAEAIAKNWDGIVETFSKAWNWIGKIGSSWSSLFGGGSAQPAAPAARVAGRGGLSQRMQGEVAIRFDNPPPGMRVERVRKSGDLDLAVDQGLVMGGR